MRGEGPGTTRGAGLAVLGVALLVGWGVSSQPAPAPKPPTDRERLTATFDAYLAAERPHLTADERRALAAGAAREWALTQGPARR